MTARIGVLVQDAPLAASINATALGGLRPTLTPAPHRRAPSCGAPSGGSGTITDKAS